MKRAIPILVDQLSSQALLTLPPEAKLSKVPIPPIMLTMEGFRFWLWFWVLFGLWFLLTRFLLTWFLSLLPKQLVPQDTIELDGFLEVVVTIPPEIILYYRLNHSIWSLSDNKEASC
jgi:hypothetical protein